MVERAGRGPHLILAVFLATPAARAAPIASAVDDFRLDFTPAYSQVCVVVPAAETRAEDCQGLDPDRLARRFAGEPDLEWAAVVSGAGGRYELSYLAHTGGSVRPFLATEPPLFHDHLGDVEVFRTERAILDGASPTGQTLRVRYLLPARTALHELRVLAFAPATRAKADVVAAIPNVHVRVSVMARIGRYAPMILGLILGVGALGVAVGGFYLARRRRAHLPPA